MIINWIRHGCSACRRSYDDHRVVRRRGRVVVICDRK